MLFGNKNEQTNDIFNNMDEISILLLFSEINYTSQSPKVMYYMILLYEIPK